MKRADAKKCWVGFDLGGTKMMATVFDAKFAALARKRRKTKGQAGAGAGLERMVELIRGALDEAGVTADALAGIGVGAPGPLDIKKGVVMDLPNLGWRKVQVRRKLRKVFGCGVTLCNDVDAGVYGEYRFGAGRGAHCLVGVFPGTGIGGGCVYRGELLRGRKASCMEIGHMCVVPNGAPCGCGRRGCLETVASRLSIAAAAAAAAHRGEAPHLLDAAGMDLSRMKSGVLAQAVKAGDAAVEAIVRDAAAWLGLAVGNVVNLLLPDVVVLGGGLVQAMPDIFLEEVEAAARAHVMPPLAGDFEVRISALGDDAVALGAAAWAEYSLTMENAT
ncbi:MAG: ROK family protein [Lentisphaerae bacterium]|nr:ROK family protein [Lentisphaerota bacterium]